MDLPLETQNLIKLYLELVRNDPKHILTASDRVALYRSYGYSRIDRFIEKEKLKPKRPPFDFIPGPEYDDDIVSEPLSSEKLIENLQTKFNNYTLADYAQCWLAVLTVEKVLFIWEDWNWELYRFNTNRQNRARKITETSRAILQKTITIRDIWDLLCGDFNLGLNIDNWVPYQVYSVYEAAYFAIEFITGDDFRLGPIVAFDWDDYEGNYDEAEYSKDFATSAVKAYTAIDPNPPGEIKLWPQEFDVNKRIEFWEWWLTEAVPQAWELANNSF